MLVSLFMPASFLSPVAPSPDQWLLSDDTSEGQLSVDLYRRDQELVIRCPIAGVRPEDVDISIDHDLLTIRGSREHQEDVSEEDWFHRECYWGSFSRTIILPADVNSEKTEASFKNGILEIRLPIRPSDRRIVIRHLDA